MKRIKTFSLSQLWKARTSSEKIGICKNASGGTQQSTRFVNKDKSTEGPLFPKLYQSYRHGHSIKWKTKREQLKGEK